MEMLMSIKKEHSDKIFFGGKTIEVRRTVPKEITYPIKSYLYETKSGQGKGKVIGYFECFRVIPTDIFKQDKKHISSNIQTRKWISQRCGISEEELFSYAYPSKTLYLYMIERALRYEEPKNIEEFGISYPPNSWVYINQLKEQ